MNKDEFVSGIAKKFSDGEKAAVSAEEFLLELWEMTNLIGYDDYLKIRNATLFEDADYKLFINVNREFKTAGEVVGDLIQYIEFSENPSAPDWGKIWDDINEVFSVSGVAKTQVAAVVGYNFRGFNVDCRVRFLKENNKSTTSEK